MEHLAMKKKVTIMLAIMSALLFAALNQTIISTALPQIVSDLGGLQYYNWIFTIYMLTSSVTTILVGKLSDIYGRKMFILIGIGVFFVGSFLCGTSSSMLELILNRGLQGFGFGMIMSTAFASVGDLFSPRDRGRWQGILGATFGMSSLLGPTLGGYIVDNFDWSWVFWVFLPFGVVAFTLIAILFPKVEQKDREPIDFLGSILLTLTLVPGLLAVTWGGRTYPWLSWQIITLFAVTVLSFIFFIYVEKKAKSPVLPLNLFKNSIFTITNAAGFILGAGMFSAIMFMPMFIQGVIGTSATISGFVMMPMTLSMVISSTIGGQIITKTGKYKGMVLIGLTLIMTGLFLMSRMGIETTNVDAIINMLFVGTGLGLSFPVMTLVVQNAVKQRLLGVATSSAQLFRQLGGAVGVAVMQTVLSTQMHDKVVSMFSGSKSGSDASGAGTEALAQLKDPKVLMDPSALADIRASLPDAMIPMFNQLVENLRIALSYGLHSVFMSGVFIVAVGIILMVFLKKVPLRTTNDSDSGEGESEAGSEGTRNHDNVKQVNAYSAK